MARIRTIKPEAFESEDLASVDVTAMVTFFGLLTQADDSGRFRDHPAIIAGRLWALRAEHTPANVAVDLEQLAGAGLICRYTGCDGNSYLHIATWEKHQKIDRPSASRRPRCPVHQSHQKCGGCSQDSCPAAEQTRTARPTAPDVTQTVHPRRALESPESPAAGEPDTDSHAMAGSRTVRVSSEGPLVGAPSQVPDKFAGQTAFAEDSMHPREGSASGSRILDPGSSPKGGTAPAPSNAAPGTSTKALVAEYVRGCAHRPPKDVVALVGRQVKGLLEEGFDPDVIRPALGQLRIKGLHATVLPSLVNEALNASRSPSAVGASGAGPWGASGYVPYLDPAAEPSGFGGQL
ncbi:MULTISPECIES: hypothetical protein [unclassified Streptomyces]|uniref:hypothetical protein n=1 Tax=unclassified Streptomyces TaxID=2593676 RepID=UPI0029663071|nr:hypothetical protein [Streptomyces sp. SJL17-1]